MKSIQSALVQSLLLLPFFLDFVQHDQVKSELIKQKAVPLLMRCVVEQHFDPIKVQSISIEILLGLSFHNEASTILRKDQHFLNRIRFLSNKTDAKLAPLQRAAEGLLWKLEKEEQAVAKSTNLHSYQYDIMISYSHRDEDICLKIYEKLVQDGYRVWLDQDCLRGPTMVGMANAIENSEYVLIHMSSAYKQSVYCQAEANYAFERGCRLIPIVIEKDYKPDGWLGIIASGKIFVDFGKMSFQAAYKRLTNEISERRHEHFTRSLSRCRETDSNAIVPQNVPNFRRMSYSIG